MLTRKVESSGACARRGLLEQLAEAIYEASLRHTLKWLRGRPPRGR
jgi:hypothetical protein